MRNFISEDDIEQAILQKLEGDPFQYGVLRCDPSPDKRELLPDGTGRSSKKECVLPLTLTFPGKSWRRSSGTCAAISVLRI